MTEKLVFPESVVWHPGLYTGITRKNKYLQRNVKLKDIPFGSKGIYPLTTTCFKKFRISYPENVNTPLINYF